MEFIGLLTMGVFVLVVLYLLSILVVSPLLTYRKLKKNGLTGPIPSFPLGNLTEMKKKNSQSTPSSAHDVHSTLFPYFARWQKAYGKMFVYWLGTEPFLYVADAELLKKLSSEVTAKNWGKPAVFRRDRAPMFGNGLVMSEGDDWVRHRHVITPAFNPTNLKAMANLMVETATTMLDNWTTQINTSGAQEIDVEHSISVTAGEIIAKTSFGISYQSGRQVFEKLRTLQMTLFKTNRFVGVPFGKYMYPRKTLEARRLGDEINQLFISIIGERKKTIRTETHQHDLLGMLLKESDKPGNFSRSLTTQEVVDECKTFFFGGHETTALAITWTMLLLATHTDWQDELRAEVKEVLGDGEIVVNKLAGLKKMGWVMNEVLRLYPSAPNSQRQAKNDIHVSEDLTIPKGTNMWIDTVGMHHDPELWGEDVHEFKPERFKDDIHGGCKHKMGYLPFGFGGRMCIGRNLTFLEYKIVLSLILSRFSFTVSPTYTHAPSIALSLRPCNGLPIVLHPIN